MSCQGRSPDGEAGEPSCQRVAARGQQLPAEHHLIEEAREQEREHDRHRRHERKRANARLAEGADLVGDVIEGRGVGDAEVDAREYVGRAEGQHEAVDLRPVDEQSVDDAADDAEHEAGRQRYRHRDAVADHQAGLDDRHQASDRADRKVHLPQRQHDHLSQRDQEQDRKIAAGNEEVVGREEGWREDRQHEHADEVDEEQAQGHAGGETAQTQHHGAAPPAARVTLSSTTASSSTTPRNTVIQKLSMPTSSRPLEMVASRTPPRMVPGTETRPPERRVPPMAGATKEARSQSLPRLGEAVCSAATAISPAVAASAPESPWVSSTTRSTDSPDIRAARRLAPTASISLPRLRLR